MSGSEGWEKERGARDIFGLLFVCVFILSFCLLSFLDHAIFLSPTHPSKIKSREPQWVFFCILLNLFRSSFFLTLFVSQYVNCHGPLRLKLDSSWWVSLCKHVVVDSLSLFLLLWRSWLSIGWKGRSAVYFPIMRFSLEAKTTDDANHSSTE